MNELLTKRLKRQLTGHTESGMTLVEVLIASVLFLILLGGIGAFFVNAYKVTDVVSTSSYDEAEIVQGSNKIVQEITNTTEFIAAGDNFINVKSVDDQGQGNVALRQNVIYFYYDPDLTTTAQLREMGIPNGTTIPNVKGLIEYRETDPDSSGNEILPTSVTVVVPNMVPPTAEDPIFTYFALNNQELTTSNRNGLKQLSDNDVVDAKRVEIYFSAQPENRENPLEISTSASPRWLGGGYEDSGNPDDPSTPTVPPPTASILSCVSNNSSNSTSSIRVSWSAATGASGYSIYRENRRTASGTPQLLATVNGKNTVSYTDSAIRDGEEYTYYLITWGDGGESAPSNTTTCQSIPSSINQPVASENGDTDQQRNQYNSIDVEFDKVSNQRVTRLEVETRRNWSGSWSDLSTINVGSSNYETNTSAYTRTESNVLWGERRDYRVRVCNEAGCSDWTTDSSAGTVSTDDDRGLMRRPATPGCSISGVTTRSMSVTVNPQSTSNSGNDIIRYYVYPSFESGYDSYASRGSHRYDPLRDNTVYSFQTRVQNDRGWSDYGPSCSDRTDYLQPVTSCSISNNNGGRVPATLAVTANGGSAGFERVKWGNGNWIYSGYSTSYRTAIGWHYAYASATDGYNYSGTVSCSEYLAPPPLHYTGPGCNRTNTIGMATEAFPAPSFPWGSGRAALHWCDNPSLYSVDLSAWGTAPSGVGVSGSSTRVNIANYNVWTMFPGAGAYINTSYYFDHMNGSKKGTATEPDGYRIPASMNFRIVYNDKSGSSITRSCSVGLAPSTAGPSAGLNRECTA